MDSTHLMRPGDKIVHLQYCSAGDVDRARETVADGAVELSQHDHFDILFLNSAADKGVDGMARRAVQRLSIRRLMPYEFRLNVGALAAVPSPSTPITLSALLLAWRGSASQV